MFEDIKMILANENDKQVLKNLMQLYRHDFSVYDNEDVDEFGRYEYPYLDDYWIEPTRFPFFIQVGGNYAGFVLIRHGCYNFKTQQEDQTLLSIAEFFVMRKYRRKGIGEWVANWAFDEFAGRWQVTTPLNNHAAKQFWKNTISSYTNHRYITFAAAGDTVFQFMSPPQ